MLNTITIEEFADGFIEKNKDIDRRQLIKSLKETLKAKNNGAECIICGQPIWAVGSAITGNKMCFTCLTGETDDSDDYEID